MVATLIDRIVLTHELLCGPRPISVKDMIALQTANPETFGRSEANAFDIAQKLRGYSKAECRRRGVSMSEPQDTPRATLKWASVKLGKNDYEPVFIEWN